jgi:hypothetical protein
LERIIARRFRPGSTLAYGGDENLFTGGDLRVLKAEGLVDPVVLKIYLHAAILTAYKTGTIEVPRLVLIMFVIISVASAEPVP